MITEYGDGFVYPEENAHFQRLSRCYDDLLQQDPVSSLRLGIEGSDEVSNGLRAQLAYELMDVSRHRSDEARDRGDFEPRIETPAPLGLMVKVKGDLTALVAHPDFEHGLSDRLQGEESRQRLLEEVTATYTSPAWVEAAPAVHDADPARWTERLTTVWVSIDAHAELEKRGVADQLDGQFDHADSVHDGLMRLHDAGRTGPDIDEAIDQAVSDVDRAATKRDGVLRAYGERFVEEMDDAALELGISVRVRDIKELEQGRVRAFELDRPLPPVERSPLVEALSEKARRNTPLPPGITAPAEKPAPEVSVSAGRAWELSQHMTMSGERAVPPNIGADTNAPGRAVSADRAREVGYSR